MNEFTSKKIKFLSFFAIVGVVFCHAYNYANRFLLPTTVLAEGANPGTMLQFFISNGLVRFAVPLFFAFSGYLFFVAFDFTWKGYLKKVLKRLRTLVVPYLIWTVLAAVLLFLVYRLVGLERYSIVHEKIGIAKANGVWVWLLNSPAFQLWYIYDLFLLVLISPLIYFLVKKCKWIPLVIFGILWLLGISIYVDCEGVLFFTLGAYFAVNKIKLPGLQEGTKSKGITALFVIVWIVGCFCYSLISGVMGTWSNVTKILWVLYKINVLTGIIAVWRLYDFNCGEWQNKKIVKEIVGSTIFIYFAHEPILHLLTDVCLEKMNFNGEYTLTYFGLSIGIIVVCSAFGILLRKVCPKVYGVLTGGR